MAFALAGSASAQNIYIADQNAAVVSVINSVSGVPTTTLSPGLGPVGVAVTPDGKTVLVANGGANSVSIIDTASASVKATVAVGRQPAGIAVAPNGATAYVANSLDNTVSVINVASGAATATVSVGLSPFGVAVLPNGASVYVANSFDNTVSVISAGSNQVSATIPVGASPIGVAASADSSTVYVTNSADNTVSVIPAGSSTASATVAVGASPFGIAASPSGGVYVANQEDGTVSVLAQGSTTAKSIALGGSPYSVAASADGSNVFVINKNTKTVAVIATSSNTVSSTIPVPGTPGSFGAFFGTGGPSSSPLLAAILPTSRSVMVGNPATAAATVLNVGTATLSNCGFSLPTSAPSTLSFVYQTLNASGQLSGSANQPVTIAAGGSQNFVLSFQSSAPIAAGPQPLIIGCSGTVPAADILGLDVLGLAFSTTAQPDVVALSATIGNNGVVAAAVNASSAFALATDNVGAAGTLTATIDTGGLQLPLTATICQSNPSTGACMGSPTTSLSVNFTSGGTPTFSVFVSPTAAIPFAPATSRVFVRFIDANGVSHGSTSVAVKTL